MLRDGDELKTKEARSIQDIEDEGEAALDQISVIMAKMNAMVDKHPGGQGHGWAVADESGYVQQGGCHAG